MKPTRVEGAVAHFTSVKPLAQAEDDANHRKAKAAVTNKSLENTKCINKLTTVVASLKQLSWTDTT